MKAAQAPDRSRPKERPLRWIVSVLAFVLVAVAVLHVIQAFAHDAWLLRAAMLTDLVVVGALGVYALESRRKLFAEVTNRERGTWAASCEAARDDRMTTTAIGDAQLGALTAQITLGAACFDRKLRCVAVNQAMAQLAGLTVERQRGLHIKEIVPGSVGDDIVEDMLRVIEGGKPLHGVRMKMTMRARPDEPRSRIFAYYPLRGSENEITGVGCTVEDVTDRVREEKDRERLVTELRAAVRARDDFLSIASHELRTPLSTLALGTSELIRAADRGTLPTAAQLRKQAERLRTQGQRLERLVATVLDVSRIVQGRVRLYPELVDVAEVVCEHGERLREEASRVGSTISLSCQEPIVGNFDRTRLEQIVDNLLSNAIKFGAGKPIDVTVESRREIVRLSVTDRGMGIPRDDQARIFERFERAVSSKHYGGLGLGLWVVRQIVESMRGKIFVTSEIGEGSTFVVEWPRGLT